MPVEFKLPNLGENISSGDITNVLVREGQQLAPNTAIIEIETGKATVEIPYPGTGQVSKVLVQPGQTVPVGAVLIEVEPSTASAAPAAPANSAAAPAAPPAPAANATPAAASTAPARAGAAPVAVPAPAPTNGGRSAPVRAAEPVAETPAAVAPAGPAIRRLARELGIDLHRVAGSGPGGRITREDVIAAVRKSTSVSAKSAVKSGPLPEGTPGNDKFGAIRRQRMTRTRRTIAENMERSLSIPQVTNFDDADITELERMRKSSQADYAASEIKLTMLAFVMKAVAQSLRLHPNLNASIDMEAGEIIYKDYVNLGIAVDTDKGLVVPVIRDVDHLSIPAIAQALTELARKARANQFTMEDLTGATFTISNLGTIGGIYSTPIINSPEVAILLTGRSRHTPLVVADDKLEVRLLMPLSLSYDHRLIDGATAARFLNEVKGFLQAPGRLLLAS